MYKQIEIFIEKSNKFKICQNTSILKIFFIIFIILYGNKNLFQCRNKIKAFIFLNKNKKFAFIRRTTNPISGLFSYYIRFLGCVRKYMIQGFIPILDLKSYKNVMNGFNANSSKGNPWEYYFNQPFGYKYDKITKRQTKIKYFECNKIRRKPHSDIFLNKRSMNYWHNLAEQYIPIKEEIIKESNNIRFKLFKKSNNILGVLLRGTDYIARKPRKHSIPPKTEDAIRDVKIYDNKYKYDWIFLATEDNIIRKEFIGAIGRKVKCLINKKAIFYNYKAKKFLAYNIDLKNNIKFNKIYLLNIIILSKCLDFIGARTSGTIGVFIFSKGFRNYKVYDLGKYK